MYTPGSATWIPLICKQTCTHTQRLYLVILNENTADTHTTLQMEITWTKPSHSSSHRSIPFSFDVFLIPSRTEMWDGAVEQSMRRASQTHWLSCSPSVLLRCLYYPSVCLLLSCQMCGACVFPSRQLLPVNTVYFRVCWFMSRSTHVLCGLTDKYIISAGGSHSFDCL